MLKRVLIGIAIVAAGALGVAIYQFNVSGGGSGGTLSGQARADFVRSAATGCVATQKASPQNAEVGQPVIEAYCGCYAEALAKRITTKDLETLTGRAPAEMQAEVRPKMEDSERVCMATLDEEKK